LLLGANTPWKRVRFTLGFGTNAALSAADDWVSIAQYGKAKQDWFAKFLSLPNGIPSHDTFNRVFSKIDPEQFMNCFLKD
jgi:hypothetical protein